VSDWIPEFEAFMREQQTFFSCVTTRYCELRGVPRDFVEDVLQDAGVILFRKWPTELILAEREERRAYMCRVLQLTVRNTERRRRTEAGCRGPSLDDPRVSATDQVSTEDQVLAAAGRQQFYDAVASLPLQQQEVYELHKIAGLSVKDVAQQLGKSESNVTTTANKAIRKLRVLLPRDLLEEFDAERARVILREGGGAA
jgi:RNA polymerase sigma factor (sigma-70 family)